MADLIDIGWTVFERMTDPRKMLALENVANKSLVSIDYSPYFGFTDQRVYVNKENNIIIYKNSVSRGALKAFWPVIENFDESLEVALRLSESGIDVDVPYDFVGKCDGRDKVMTERWQEIVTKITTDYQGSKNSELRLSLRRLEKEGVTIRHDESKKDAMDIYNKWKKRARDIDKDTDSSKFRERALDVIRVAGNYKATIVYYKQIPTILAISERCGKQIQGTVAYYDPFFISEFRQPYWIAVCLSMRNWSPEYEGRYFNQGDVCQWKKGSEELETNALKNKTKFLETQVLRRYHIPPRK